MALLQEVPVALVPLLNRRRETVGYALVDCDDLPLLGSAPWHLDSTGYAARGKPARRLHRLLMQPSEGFEVDHINGNKLDNRRSNLRLVTHAENTQNHRSRGGQSQHRGVYQDRRDGAWYGQVKHNGVRYSTGRFPTEEQAAVEVSRLRARILWASVEDVA